MRLIAALFIVSLLFTGPLHPDDATPGPQPGGAAGNERTTEELKEELEEFVPSEGLPADSAISFPVDI
jgi:hypothetical protein